MNTLQKLRLVGLSLLLLTGLSVQNEAKAQPGVSISFQTFYNELSPYGRWINSPQYGSVWAPNVSQGFQPYSTNGYWEVTEYGNTWVSDYDWGWAPFHYGRWSFDDYNGWFWVPGYEWGPAWVNWRSGGDYYGWAPLGPGMNVNISINIPSFWWVFVPQRYIASRSWYNYCAPRNRVTHIYNQTTIINNYYRGNNRVYAYGPRRDEIERVTRRSVPVRQIDMNQRGRVITDHSRRTYGYDAPDHNAPVYRSDRGSSSGRTSRGDQNSGRSYPSNERSGNPAYESPGRTREYGQVQESSRGRNSNPEIYNNRSAEQSRPANVPNAEHRREYGNPSERSSRSSRSADMGSFNRQRSGSEAPAVRSAPAERNQAPRNNGRSESRSDGNSSGGGRSERSSRSPR
jgi:hypothetical protein